ncbi:protein FAR1-RELATED SEQUENCE 5-like [Carya illinoinensis]|uniref:protein FAR1-RELATED SEQUENCE 5-like n=1 Tax=Carya illinoinensis TaxID=32201 RepID=UPI001C720B86|nr:protein FAR1-RELATED SEQUENCE 5-like [Carya illinoinensis]
MDTDIEHLDKECDKVGIDKEIDCDETIEEPIVGMSFSSVEEVRSYYMKYGKQKGFGVCKRNSRQDDDGNVRWICLACARGGTSKSKAANVMKPRQTEKIGCMARINARLNDEGGYTLSKVILDHTHVCSPGKARHFRCFKKVDARVAKRLEINDEAGIRLSKNFKAVVVEAGGYENVPFGEKECRNYIDKARQLRLGVGGSTALCNYFDDMQKRNPEFYYKIDVDNEMRLKNVFWADARNRAAYESFGDVITFDTTYLTNAYKMPFAPFVGVNHHGQSILFGCGLISNEDANTFEWLFESWLKCMNDQPPNAIITDQDKAMKIAISRVFPTSRHRFCLWHIMKKLPEKFGSHYQYEEIKNTLHKCVYDSFSEKEFEAHWGDMLDTYDLHENAWLVSLYSDRYFWVPAYVRDTFWAGMSITQRSEGMNAFFEDYVNTKTTLKQFVDQYDSALRRKVENEAIADFNSFNTKIPCITRYPLEKQFQKAYTIAKFKEVQEELRGLIYLTTTFLGCEGARYKWVVADEVQVSDNFLKRVNFTVEVDEDPLDVKCNCKLFEFRGILCRHALRILTQLGKDTIPSKYILDRWKKDVKRKYIFVKSSYDTSSIDDTRRYDRIQNAFYELCSNASKAESSCVKLISQIEQLKVQYPGIVDCDTSTTVDPVTSMEGTTGRVLSPLVVRSKGRPPTKRKVHPVEKSLKKSSTRRRLHRDEVEVPFY